MVVALLLLTLTIAACILNRGIINPVSITLAVLTLSIGLAALRFFDLYEFDSIAENIVAVGAVSVFVGALLAPKAVRDRVKDHGCAEFQDSLIRYGRLNVALFASLVIILVARWPQLQIILKGGTLGEVRNLYLGYGGLAATVDFVDRLFVGPVITVALPIFLWCVLRQNVDRLFGALFVIVLILNQLTSGGRFTFLYAGIMVFALLAHSGGLRVRTKRAKVILIILIAAVVVFTLARGNSLLFEAYTYAAVPVPLLAHWATFVESSGTQTFGGSFLYGILTLLFRLSEIVGSPIGSDVSAAVALPQDHWVELLPGRPFNAFVTMFYYFFLDFRWAGVAVGGLAWGLLGQISYMRMWTSGLRATLFGLLMLQVAIMAFVRWEFSNGSFVIGLAMLLFFVKSGSVRSENPLSSPIESAGRRA